jgi:hypothetical protein
MNQVEQVIFEGVIVAIVSGVFTWSLAMLTVGRKVNDSITRMELNIQSATNDVHRCEDEVAALRKSTDDRILSISGLVQEVLRAANNLIDVVRLQNELLVREINKK